MAKYNEKYFKSDEMHINRIDDMLVEERKSSGEISRKNLPLFVQKS